MCFVPKERHIVSSDEPANYNGIDMVKFLCAILVFIIHIPPFSKGAAGIYGDINFGLQHGLCRISVPFYLISSGFFLFRKMPADHLNLDVLRDYCFKTLRLLGMWHVLLFLGGTVHLWYLGATVVAVCLVGLCFYLRMRFGHICILAGLLYIIGLLGDAYYGVIAPLESIAVFRYLFGGYSFAFSTTRNGVFMGFIFVLMGAAFSRRAIRLKPQTALAGFAVSALCLLAEAFLLEHYGIPSEYNMYVFLLPASFFLFSFACSLRLRDRPIYKRLRKTGVLLYFTHLFVGELVLLAIRIVRKFLGIELAGYRFVFSLAAALLFAAGAERLSRQKGFKWINWLLS